MTSALYGIINRMAEAGIEPEAVAEVRRVLELLRAEGWSGFITADEALRALVRDRREATP